MISGDIPTYVRSSTRMTSSATCKHFSHRGPASRRKAPCPVLRPACHPAWGNRPRHPAGFSICWRARRVLHIPRCRGRKKPPPPAISSLTRAMVRPAPFRIWTTPWWTCGVNPAGQIIVGQYGLGELSFNRRHGPSKMSCPTPAAVSSGWFRATTVLALRNTTSGSDNRSSVASDPESKAVTSSPTRKWGSVQSSDSPSINSRSVACWNVTVARLSRIWSPTCATSRPRWFTTRTVSASVSKVNPVGQMSNHDCVRLTPLFEGASARRHPSCRTSRPAKYSPPLSVPKPKPRWDVHLRGVGN